MILRTVFLAAGLLITLASLSASTPEKEQAFVAAYRKAFENNDQKGLLAFLYTKGAHPMVLELYSLMTTEGAGTKNAKFELRDLTPEEMKEAGAVREGPNGLRMKLPIKPTKRLVITTVSSPGGNSGTTTREVFVAEAGGKLVIPVPMAVE